MRQDYVVAKTTAPEDFFSLRFYCEQKIREYVSPYYRRSLMPLRRIQENLLRTRDFCDENSPQIARLFQEFSRKKCLDKEDIVTCLYPDERYHPMMHDSRVYTVLRRLNAKVAAQKLRVVRRDKGWQLEKDHRFSESKIDKESDHEV